MRRIPSRSAALLAGIALSVPGPQAGAEAAQTALTVYSSAQPGAIPADWYRPLPGQGTPPASASRAASTFFFIRPCAIASAASSCADGTWRTRLDSSGKAASRPGTLRSLAW